VAEGATAVAAADHIRSYFYLDLDLDCLVDLEVHPTVVVVDAAEDAEDVVDIHLVEILVDCCTAEEEVPDLAEEDLDSNDHCLDCSHP